MRLLLCAKLVFGRPLYYPRCLASETLCKILNKKTLSQEQTALLLKAGFEIDYTNEGSHLPEPQFPAGEESDPL